MRMLAQAFLALALVIAHPLHAADAVNINTADAPALAQALKGVGIKRAEAIIAYRKANGPFKSVDDLAKVDGIGKATVEKNRANLTVK